MRLKLTRDDKDGLNELHHAIKCVVAMYCRTIIYLYCGIALRLPFVFPGKPSVCSAIYILPPCVHQARCCRAKRSKDGHSKTGNGRPANFPHHLHGCQFHHN